MHTYHRLIDNFYLSTDNLTTKIIYYNYTKIIMNGCALECFLEKAFEIFRRLCLLDIKR